MARGPLPVTASDIQMSKQHLKATMKLEKQKVSDHLAAFQNTSNSASKAYHKAHAKNHKKDLKTRAKYLKKVAKLKVKAGKK